MTIYLDSSHLPAKGLLGTATSENHGTVERHLERELAAGWKIKMLHGFGGHGEHLFARGWVTVVLEKDEV